MGKVLIIDLTKCNGCHNCQIACKDEHVGNDWSPIAAPEPLTGQFWVKVSDIVRGSFPKVKVAYFLTICQHCDNAPCIDACTNGAIYKRSDGIVIIDPEKCKGSRDCVKACPYEGAIYFNEDLNIAQKCTFCAHLIDKGWEETRCSDACPTGALTFGEEDELEKLIAEAETLKPELETRPRVYYKGLPKKFIAGTVFDPKADEVLIDADVDIVNVSTGKHTLARTDDFGDFWVDGLLPDTYTVIIRKNGYSEKRLDTDITAKDVNLGDIPMQGEL
jgi:tetrathionate reductase subunit B